jgi:hypothetical protein
MPQSIMLPLQSSPLVQNSPWGSVCYWLKIIECPDE